MKPNTKYESVPILELQIRTLQAKIDALNDVSMEVVEPCEPDCGAVRHALHQGSWNAHLVIENRIAELTKQLKEITQ